MALIAILVWSGLILGISIVAMASEERDPRVMGERSYQATGILNLGVLKNSAVKGGVR
jgi:hypothetical protein